MFIHIITGANGIHTHVAEETRPVWLTISTVSDLQILHTFRCNELLLMVAHFGHKLPRNFREISQLFPLYQKFLYYFSIFSELFS